MKSNLTSILIFSLFLITTGCEKEENKNKNPEEPGKIEADGTFIDKRDGRRYKTVKIGNQIWMAENLAYLPEGATVSNEKGHSYTEKHYYIVDQNENIDEKDARELENYKHYGVMYNWPAAIEAPPAGWHLASLAEWNQLADYISKDNGGYNKNGLNWEKVGGHLKSAGLSNKDYDYWRGNFERNDEYGFKLLAGGRRGLDYFYSLFWDTALWTSTPQGYSYAYEIRVDCNSDVLRISDSAPRYYGYYIRCIKD